MMWVRNWYKVAMGRVTRLSKLLFPLTVFGRSFVLISLLLLVNGVCWGVAAQWHSLLGLSVLAWTIGLRHALDADHISAIDNATRTLISHGQLPVTCGFFFSLGHSTIVIAANLAIVVSISAYNKLNAFNNLASVIGTAISASFLFIVGLGNSIILWRIIRQRRVKHTDGKDAATGADSQTQNTLMMRVLGPLVNFVNRPWKMYPVGVLFGLGFDTASSIALLALSALAQQNGGDNRIRPSQVLVLPLLFTGGMTLVDSLNSVMMLYSYSGFAEHSWKIFERTIPANAVDDGGVSSGPDVDMNGMLGQTQPERTTHLAQQQGTPANPIAGVFGGAEDDGNNVARKDDRVTRAKRHTMSNLSVLLTSMSILLAFSIALIEVMGLIGQECARCRQAASAADGGGLAGKWWRAWQRANDNSGYIGAAVAGAFLLIVIGWFGVRRIIKARRIFSGASEGCARRRACEGNTDTRV
ncbi:NicO-domain-containing protein [Pisolithus orientalis]|uniref:NicO-domain-containing protein n=1 Tax=Pisolithus orientalis TaxID=936130 RepID=UPI0022250B7D|nr:NicO-domain-containing protein [Pisolithus orientalis]KAI6030737.1 NicO-domain-containing protein [Pisolithus orientalis]